MVLQTFIKWIMCPCLLEAEKAHFLKIVKKKQSGLVTYAFSSQSFGFFSAAQEVMTYICSLGKALFLFLMLVCESHSFSWLME